MAEMVNQGREAIVLLCNFLIFIKIRSTKSNNWNQCSYCYAATTFYFVVNFCLRLSIGEKGREACPLTIYSYSCPFYIYSFIMFKISYYLYCKMRLIYLPFVLQTSDTSPFISSGANPNNDVASSIFYKVLVPLNFYLEF